jgi:hypothetical protein
MQLFRGNGCKVGDRYGVIKSIKSIGNGVCVVRFQTGEELVEIRELAPIVVQNWKRVFKPDRQRVKLVRDHVPAVPVLKDELDDELEVVDKDGGLEPELTGEEELEVVNSGETTYQDLVDKDCEANEEYEDVGE